MKWLFHAVFLVITSLLVGGVVHITSLLALPYLAPKDAYSRLVSFGEENTIIALDDQAGRKLPLQDPAFVHVACRFNLAEAPVRIRVPVVGDYVTASFYGRDGVSFFSLNDRSASAASIDVELYDAGDTDFRTDAVRPGTIPVASPDLQGYVLVRAFAPTESLVKNVRDGLGKALCEPVAHP